METVVAMLGLKIHLFFRPDIRLFLHVYMLYGLKIDAWLAHAQYAGIRFQIVDNVCIAS